MQDVHAFDGDRKCEKGYSPTRLFVREASGVKPGCRSWEALPPPVNDMYRTLDARGQPVYPSN